jgi:hypothetical protein
VTTDIAATPVEVWKVISDPVGLGRLTTECDAMEWVGSWSAPAVGAEFRGHNRHGMRRWTTRCLIVRYQPDQEIAWDVSFGPLPVARWSYLVSPRDDGTTTLRERYEDQRGAVIRATGPIVRGTRDADGHNRRNMEATLARIKDSLEE